MITDWERLASRQKTDGRRGARPPIIHAVRQGGEPSYTLYLGSVGTQNTLVPSGHVAEGRKLGGCSFIHAQILFDLRDAAA